MKRSYLIILSLIVGAAALFTAYKYFKKPAVKQQISTINKGDIVLKVLATGTVQPENRLQIKSPISGRAESILVKEGQKVSKGQTLAWISSTERAVMIDSARALGAEEVKKWEEIYKATPIVAPLSGTIIMRAIEPGQTFTSADAIFVMADRLVVSAQVDETDLAQIFLQQKSQITLDAYPDKSFNAEVSQLAYEAKTVNNVTTYTVLVRPLDKIDFLRSGMTANVVFYGTEKKDVTVIPNEFIKYESGKTKTLLKQGKKNQEVEIELGLTDGKLTEVKSGLKVGDSVVLEIAQDTQLKKNMFSGPQRRNQRR